MSEQSSIYKHSLKLERRTASLYVQSTGCQQCSPGYGWGPGIRDHFLLHHILSGRGTCIISNQKYALQAGDSFLVYPETTVHYYADHHDAKVDGFVLTAEKLDELLDGIFARTPEEIAGESCLPLRRAEIVGGGAVIVREVMRLLSLDKIAVSERDNLEGYLLRRLKK